MLTVNMFEKGTHTVNPRAFSSFREISSIGKLNREPIPWIQSDKNTKQKIFSLPKNFDSVPLLLYWNNQISLPSGKKLFSFIEEGGYTIPSEGHISLLLGMMNYFSDEKLDQCGIPVNVGILFPTAVDETYKNSKGERCFACIGRGGLSLANRYRHLDLLPFYDEHRVKDHPWCLILAKDNHDPTDLLS